MRALREIKFDTSFRNSLRKNFCVSSKYFQRDIMKHIYKAW